MTDTATTTTTTTTTSKAPASKPSLFPVTVWISRAELTPEATSDALKALTGRLNQKETDDPYIIVEQMIGTSFQITNAKGDADLKTVISLSKAHSNVQFMPREQLMKGDIIQEVQLSDSTAASAPNPTLAVEVEDAPGNTDSQEENVVEKKSGGSKVTEITNLD